MKNKLMEAALDARKMAYSPYSHFCVGAALLAKDGRIFKGCNIENASYGATNCAERTAFFRAVSEGVRDFEAIAIAGGKEGQAPEGYCYPCGICRQVMQEFAGPDFVVYVVKSKQEYRELTMEQLLPYSFSSDILEENK